MKEMLGHQVNEVALKTHKQESKKKKKKKKHTTNQHLIIFEKRTN